MTTIYDVAIVGSGTAGSLAAIKIAQDHKNLNCVLLDGGRSAAKRRTQMWGFNGLFPNSDGKLYKNNIKEVISLSGSKNTKAAEKWLYPFLEKFHDINIIKDTLPNKNILNKIKKSGFKVSTNNYMQVYPKDIHLQSKMMGDILYETTNIFSSFDNEVLDITKEKNKFIITTQEGEFFAKKVLLCSGRISWRWTHKIFKDFGIVHDNNYNKYGVRLEIVETAIKQFNGSNCSLFRDDLELGPFSHGGTIIPEDHGLDLAISSFRSNEDRWKTDKMSFNLFGKREFKDNGIKGGVEHLDRIAQLTFMLTNERISKERVSTLLNGKSKISPLPEYDWLPEAIKEVATFIPEILTKGYFHVPTIMPLPSKVKLKKNLETKIPGLYLAGETTGASGLLSAMLTGVIAADQICKDLI